MDDLGYYLGIDVPGAVAILVSTVLLYFAFAGLLARLGQRMYSSPSALDLAIVTVLGAIVGRAILGQVPTLSGGLLALATLFGVEAAAGRVRRSERMRARSQHRAVALMVAGRVDRVALHRHHLDEVALWGVLRAAGIRSPSEVALVVLEKSGKFSVLRAGEPIHPAALTGLRRANEVLERISARESGA